MFKFIITQKDREDLYHLLNCTIEGYHDNLSIDTLSNLRELFEPDVLTDEE